MPKSARGPKLRSRLVQPSRIILIALNLMAYFFLARWASANIDIMQLGAHLKVVPFWALLGTIAIHLSVLALCGLRMTLLLPRKFATSFAVVNLGYSLNAVLPFRLGEPAKIYFSHRLLGIPLTTIFAASVAEKILEFTMLLLVVAWAVAFTAAEFVHYQLLLSLGIVALAAVITLILFLRHITRIVRWLPKGSRLRRVAIELHKHANSYDLWHVLALSAGIWLTNIFMIFFSFNTLLPGVGIDLQDAITLLVVIALAIAIPSAPAGLGFFEAGVVAYLTQTGRASSEAALVIAAVLHIVITLPQMLIAAKLLWGSRRTQFRQRQMPDRV